ncbi:MAG TPA: hypothetical protein VIV12_13075 [Streptosporangiaceae bacterium]
MGVAVGVAGVVGDVAGRDAAAGHARQDGGQHAGRVAGAGADGHPAGQFGGARAVLVADHDGDRQVPAVAQLAVGTGQVDGAVSPVCLWVGACSGAVPRRPGPGLHVCPVRGQRPGRLLVPCGDAGLQQLIADCLEVIGGRAVRAVLAECFRHQAVGVAGLAVGELVRPGLPGHGDAEPCLAGLGQRDECRVGFGQEGGPAVVQDYQHPGQQGAGGQLPAADAGRQ